MQTLSILGATGSIGRQTLAVLEANPGHYRLDTLTAHTNAAQLAELAQRYSPRQVVLADPAHAADLTAKLAGSGVQVSAGADALTAAAHADVVVAGITGMAGLLPTMAAIEHGATVLLANKESLVCAGDMMMQAVAHHEATLLPIDSEHNALFQLYDPQASDSVVALTLTASGGPFRTWSAAQLSTATPAQAVKHPNWSMGAKISVDSASLMNKGLELIEAAYLFPRESTKLDVLIHPQSIIHGMVTYVDGTVHAAMSQTDMRIPIAHALGLAGRHHLSSNTHPLNLVDIPQLTFEAPDETRFPALRLAKEALHAGGSAPLILNSANEIAVAAFLDEKIGFMDIPALVAEALAQLALPPAQNLAELQAQDTEVRAWATARLATFSGHI